MNTEKVVTQAAFVLFGSFVVYLALLWVIAAVMRSVRAVRRVSDRLSSATFTPSGDEEADAWHSHSHPG